MVDSYSNLVYLPAALALFCKVGIYAYARRTKIRNLQTRLYLAFLFSLSVQNIAELWHFVTLRQGGIPYLELNIYYFASVLAMLFIFHLTLNLSFEKSTVYRRVLTFVYVFALFLELFLLFTPWLIQDYVRLSYSATRVPGPLYVLFEIYAIGISISLIVILSYAAHHQISANNRAKAVTMLVALVPMVLLVIGILVLLHFEVRWINATVTVPIAITYFLLVTAYAIHQNRLFDIQFYIPWSKVRKRKTAFYDRIRALIGEIAQLDSVDSALDRLADVLKCPIALVGAGKPVLASVGGSQYMSEFPKTELYKYDQILVANEITDVYPETHALMERHSIAAMVPFYPHSHNASGWLLLGDKFSDQVYSPLDFRFVEQLFDKMSDLFLDRLLDMHSQLDIAQRNIHVLTEEHVELSSRIIKLESDNRKLQSVNQQLLKEQPADSLTVQQRHAKAQLDDTVTFLGPDRKLKTALCEVFPHLKHYTRFSPRNFQRNGSTDLLIVAPPAPTKSTENALLLDVLTNETNTLAALLYGPNSRSFSVAHRDKLVGRLVEVAPDSSTAEAITRKARALGTLHRASFTIQIPDSPLLGISPTYLSLVGELKRNAGFNQPVWFKADDRAQAVAAGAALHRLSGKKGLYIVTDEENLLSDQTLYQRNDNTVIICNPTSMPAPILKSIFTALRCSSSARIVFVSSEQIGAAIGECDGLEEVMADSGISEITIPSLNERRQDLPLMVHYFTLQFNLRAGTDSYLSHDQAEQLCNKPASCRSIQDLRNVVWEALSDQSAMAENALPAHTANGSRQLSDLVGSFEAQIIKDAVRRCDGNKSRAARLLGLRPNTLHYKMERYGLVTDSENFN